MKKGDHVSNKKAKPAVTVVVGRIHKVYFESAYDLESLKDPNRLGVVTVIADTTEDAIRKARLAFPEQNINSVFCDDHKYGPPQYRPKGEPVVF